VTRRETTGRRAPWARRALVAAGALVLTGVAGCFSEPANPGAFTVEAGPGTWLETYDAEGSAFAASHVDFGVAACADGVDNDVDGVADGADAGCVGADDANERLPGRQDVVPTTLPLRVNEHGVLLVDPTDLVVQQREWCFPVAGGEPWCTGITLRGDGPARWGGIDEDEILLPIPITIELETVSGVPSPYGPGCVIPHIDATFYGSYDPATGAFEMSVDDVPVGAVPDCGAWTAPVNAALGTPTMGRSVITGTILDDEGEPVSFE
jgi:hypothetical protein